ncbi:uncharacterized protein A1O9_10256 [Exophiala aquamarina CBS 119918]|uniref:CENP-V/GFA domain-containing protein n=1 Tax=Exophiala aquamarina CBS 119918 TaxID=1182545 RepID=A0A072P165_9EURO|nr:uncharacterized protein A1O9_10256 [Exophiala aquamarina CBS 119918]KEF53854.1 hypothetical protein A1O9_10256 [Exophiala aquamarina CBS 119918]
MALSVLAKRSFNGSCHCGFIQYTAAFPPTDLPVASKCNCTICLKQGYTAIRISPEDFELISPSSKSQIKNYQMKSKDINKYFCDKCGIHCWSDGKYEYQGENHEFFTINILTLDQPQPGLDVSKFKIVYTDGRNDAFEMRDQPFLGGML